MYYEHQVAGLGKKFSDEVHHSIAHIAGFPLINQRLSNDIRRKLLKRYPFAVLYSIDENTIIVIAVDALKKKTVLLEE